MKYLLVFILLISFCQAKSQTNTDSAGVFTRENAIIPKPDGIFILRRDPADTGIYLIKYVVTKDSLGVYLTKYTFAPRSPNGSFETQILMKFTSPYILNDMLKDDFRCPDAHNEEDGTTQILTEIKDRLYTVYGFKAHVTGAPSITVFIKSKEPLHAVIYGVDGDLTTP